MRIFLSYPHKDKDKALMLKDVLTGGGHSVWTDDAIITGRNWRTELEQEILRAGTIALALTPNWLASPYCQWEFITAVEAHKKVIPILLAPVDSLPERLSQYQYADFSDGFSDEARVQKLLDNLVDLAAADPASVKALDREQYAAQIDQQTGRGNNVNAANLSGSGNIVAGGNVDQSDQRDQRNQSRINIRGSVSGGNVNIGGTQAFHGNVTINVGDMPAAPEDVRERLKAEIAELVAALNKLPPEQAEEVRMAAEDAVSEADKSQPDKRRLQIRGEALVKAAQNLLAVAPIAVKIAKTLLMIG